MNNKTTNNFTSGQIVQKKLGGSKMTVIRVIEDISTDELKIFSDAGIKSGDVVCSWSDRNKIKSGAFHPEDLKLITPTKEA